MTSEMKRLMAWKRAGRRAVLSALLGLLCANLASAAVTIETGQVEGTAQDGMTVYLGIPFAAPPVGDLRWRAPQPAAKWTGVKSASRFRARLHRRRIALRHSDAGHRKGERPRAGTGSRPSEG